MEQSAFEQAAAVLPREMRQVALALPEEAKACCEELRLRAGRGISWMAAGKEHTLLSGGKELSVTPGDLRLVLELATQSSYQIAADKLNRGFYPLKGGHRIGVSGCVTVRDGEIRAFREISSLAIRIARSFPQCGLELVPQLMEHGTLESTLILAPPGAGKTTLLRAVILTLSDRYGQRISLADERGEVAALWKGQPQFQVGRYTDVLDGCPKAEGMMLLLRSMNPQVLAADEITAPEDVDAIRQAANCGVSVLATAHGTDREDLLHRPIYRELLRQNVFQNLVRIQVWEGKRRYSLERLIWSDSAEG